MCFKKSSALVCSVSYLDGESGGGQGQGWLGLHHHQHIFPSHIAGLRGTADCWYRESGGGEGLRVHQYIFPSHIAGLGGIPDCWYREPGVGEGLVGPHHQGGGEGDTAAHPRGIRQENRRATASASLKLKLNS